MIRRSVVLSIAASAGVAGEGLNLEMEEGFRYDQPYVDELR